jgi:hypothetical protein
MWLGFTFYTTKVSHQVRRVNHLGGGKRGFGFQLPDEPSGALTLYRGCKDRSGLKRLECSYTIVMGKKMVVEPVEMLADGEVDSNTETPAGKRTSSRRYVALDDGRLTPIEPDGMVDVAISEMGARIAEVELISGSDDLEA